MDNELTKVVMGQLFPKDVLPTAAVVILAALLGFVWFVTKKKESCLIRKVSDFLADKPEWVIKISKISHMIVLALYWYLAKAYPEIKLGFLANAVVCVLICLAYPVSLCFAVVAEDISNLRYIENKENKLDS